MPQPVSALMRNLQRRWRRRRMQVFVERMRPRPQARVLDLGGTDELWSLEGDTGGAPATLPSLSVTLLNTAGAWQRLPAGSRHARVTGDACDLSRYADRAFDIVFSNGVLEHVGDDARVQRFADEARRVGKGYWIQTPSYLFPIEAHTRLPFFWFYPRPVRRALARFFDRPSARARRPDPIGETRCFTLRRLRALFPDGQVYTERVAGLPKSWTLYRPLDHAPRQEAAHASA
ncbi:MAG: methyltransferase domain-containing protein [Planctomycetota bacterium]